MKENYVSKHKFKDWLPKILSVLAAIILWYYVIDVRTTTEETTVYGVPIAITNFSTVEGLDIISGKDLTVDVVVSGTKSDIYNVSLEDLYASVDMKGITTSGTHKMDVDVVCLKKGVTVVKKNVSRINVKVDRMVSGVVPVEVVPLYSIEEQIYEMGTPVLSFDNVRITGSQDIVDTVVKAKGEFNIGQVKNNITNTVKLKLYDANGDVVDSPYIKLSDDVVTVDIPVFKREVRPVVPDFSRSNLSYTYEVTPSEIIIKGDVIRVESVKSIYTEPISDVQPAKILKRLVLPNGVTAYDVDGEVVDSVTVLIKSVVGVDELKQSDDVKGDSFDIVKD